MKNKAYIALGSNVGEKEENLAQAQKHIAMIADTKITRTSSIYQTVPWGKTDQDDFLNQVIEIETEFSPLQLLSVLLNIEINMGRQRKEKWGPRIIDLDILLYGEQTVDEPELKVPHPYLCERLFVLIPLLEINPDIVLPDGTNLKEVLIRVKARTDNKSIPNMLDLNKGSHIDTPKSGSRL
ncbi:MAG TPA: 2-amino-4-hydroxy-6-hydroxymethyldihydropteridine diphosphokinase [Syntrophomonadaceae bacterium]|nr:2-amino-4-hydroxy-6-hydroxymethyldihydropteridine diphosphokinase [Syntrophomonadaceae bacterium]